MQTLPGEVLPSVPYYVLLSMVQGKGFRVLAARPAQKFTQFHPPPPPVGFTGDSHQQSATSNDLLGSSISL